MKKSFITIIMTLILVMTCFIGLAACNDGGKDVIGVRVASDENGAEKKDSIHIGDFVYGDDGKINEALSGLKFYKQFGNNTYEEIDASKLNVKYEKTGKVLSGKPEKYSPSNDGSVAYYQYTYSIADATNTAVVTFKVDGAKSNEFSVSLSKNTWRYGEDLATVKVYNPADREMSFSQSGFDGNGFDDEDDSKYVSLSLYAMTKENYNVSGGNSITYSALTELENDENSANYGFNKVFGKNLLDYQIDADAASSAIKEGEYVLFACIPNTRNYKEIVCTAEFTVTAPDTPFDKTFVLKDITVSWGDDGSEDALSEYIQMAADMKTDNQGKTVLCAVDGKLTGTCDFGFGVFGELTGQDALTLTFGKEKDEFSEADPFYVLVKNGYDNESRMEMEGSYRCGILTLSVQQYSDGETPIWYCFNFVFELQTSDN